MSYGATPVRIELNSHKNTLLTGKNGNGKSSSVTDTLTFVLYGKAFRDITKPRLVNSENGKDCLVEVKFEILGVDYIVRRGIKPNIFEIYKNGELIPKDSDVDSYQTYLETNILRMGYKTFVQIVILGSASYTPFMQLKGPERKEITETLLDCSIYSTMHILGKQKLQNLKQSIDKQETEIRLLNISVSNAETNIQKLKESSKTDIKKLIDQIKTNKNKIEAHKKIIDKNEDIKDKIKDVKSKIAEIRSKITEFSTLKTKMEVNIEIIKKESDFFENNDDCPTCTQPIESLFKKNKLATNKDSIKKRQSNIKIANDSMKKLDKELEKVSLDLDDLLKINSNISVLQSEIVSLEKLNKTILSALKDAENSESILQENIKTKEELEIRIHELETQKRINLEDKEYYEAINSILKDGGIKTKIIRRYIPKFNKTVNKYLEAMNLYVRFTIDENFEEKILSRYKSDFTYFNFSEGEKFRIDLAILFAWREIAQERNSVSTNLLVMDEIFDSSLDSEGNEDFIKIMFNDLAKNTNLFVISHKTDQLRDKFEKVLEFEKVKGFSRLKE